MIKKISYERRIYESVDDPSYISKTDEKKNTYNKGLIKGYWIAT